MESNEAPAGAPLIWRAAAALPIVLAAAVFASASPGSAAGDTGERPAAERHLKLLGATLQTAQGEPAAGTAEPGAAPQSGAEPRESVDAPLPTILRAESDMPAPVRETREKLIEAAKSGDIEKLRALMNAQPKPPAVAFGDPGDPIEYLKALAADPDGREILAILLEVLQSGFVHTGSGTPDDLYVWPYFAKYPLAALTPGQMVELFTLLTAADYEDMKSYGSYTYFRVGIAPDGRWLFFLAGD